MLLRVQLNLAGEISSEIFCIEFGKIYLSNVVVDVLQICLYTSDL